MSGFDIKQPPLQLDFYQRPTVKVARELLGKVFVRRWHAHVLAGRIVETEAYHQDGDASCHASRGKTQRNEVMFAAGGHLYVYFTYGMHWCMNVVTEEEGVGAAVLIRGIEPLQGIEIIKENRGFKPEKQLTNGPAKCTQAFAIEKSQNGHRLDEPPIVVVDAPTLTARSIGVSQRIGISQAVELPWRFYEKENRFVSPHPSKS